MHNIGPRLLTDIVGISDDAPRRLGAQNRRGAPSFISQFHISSTYDITSIDFHNAST